MTTIQSEMDLPCPGDARRYYLRSKSDPRALIHGQTGEVFVRADGRKWEHPAVWMSRDASGPVVMQPATAYCDADRHRATDSAVAA